jgi:hypothetical protein
MDASSIALAVGCMVVGCGVMMVAMMWGMKHMPRIGNRRERRDDA